MAAPPSSAYENYTELQPKICKIHKNYFLPIFTEYGCSAMSCTTNETKHGSWVAFFRLIVGLCRFGWLSMASLILEYSGSLTHLDGFQAKKVAS